MLALSEPVAVRLKDPNGELVSIMLSGLSLSVNLSPEPCPKLISLRSVRRLVREGGGVDIGGSSLDGLLTSPGEASGLPYVRESLVSRLLGPGRPDCNPVPCAVPLLCIIDIEDLRPLVTAVGAPSLLGICVGAFKGEFTELAKSCERVRVVAGSIVVPPAYLFLLLRHINQSKWLNRALMIPTYFGSAGSILVVISPIP